MSDVPRRAWREGLVLLSTHWLHFYILEGQEMRFLPRRGIPALVQSAALMALGASSAQAAEWISATAGGDWNTANNWTSPANVPDTETESAIFRAGTANRGFNLSAAATVGSISFDNPSGGSATTQITGSSLTLDAPGAGPATISVSG